MSVIVRTQAGIHFKNFYFFFPFIGLLLTISRKKTLDVVVYYQLKSCKAVAFGLYTLMYLYKYIGSACQIVSGRAHDMTVYAFSWKLNSTP